MGSQTSKVSLCVAVYNVGLYIEKCIESILNQTYNNIEVILVDDGSKDSSGKVLDQYASKDSRVKVIHQKNQGLSVCRNTGLDNASGDYIVFVDGDDYLAPDFVEYMLHLEEVTAADIVLSKNCFTTSDFQQIKTADKITLWSPEEAVSQFFYPRLPLGAWNKMYRRSFLVEHGFRFVPELTTGEGLQFITQVGTYANCIGVGKRKVYYYRMNNPTSATTFANVERQGIGSLKTMKYIEDNLPMKERKIQKAFRWHYWSCYNYCLRQIMNANAEKKYERLYKDCIKYLRFNAMRVIFSDLPFKHRIIVSISVFSPRMAALLMIKRKQQQMKQ